MTSNLSAEKVIRVSADELFELKKLTGNLQLVLDSLVGEQTDIDSESLNSLQSLDYIYQSLSVLSSVLEEAASNTPIDWSYKKLNVFDDMPLRDLKTRYEGNNGSPKSADKLGQVDYF
jgi:hypothetical protein